MREQKRNKTAVLAVVVFVVLAAVVGINCRDDEKESIEAATARMPLPPGTVIDKNNINTETLPNNQLPAEKLLSTKEVIGRVLAVAVAEGQALTESCLIPEGIGAIGDMKNMRVFSVPITRTARPDGKPLYPGCVVDVQVAYNPTNRQAAGEHLFITMIRKVPVVAISGESVVPNPQGGDEQESPTGSSSGQAQVTLLLDVIQAEALQLAKQNGSISLSLSNH